MIRKYKGYILTALSAVMFGLSPLWATLFKSGGGNSFMLALFRNVFFMPICAVMVKRSGRPLFPKISRMLWLKLFVLSAFGLSATQLLLFMSYKYMASGICTTVHFIYPLLVFLMGAAFFRDRIDRHSAFCLVLCMAGLLCFYPRGGQISMTGLVIALLSGLTYAFYMVFMEKGGFDELTAPQISFIVSAMGAVVIALCCAFTGNLTLELAPSAWLMGILAAHVMGFAVVFCQMGIREIGARKSSLLSTFEPITSLVVGVMFMHERLDMIAVIGAGIILVSVFLFNAPSKHAASSPAGGTN